MDKEPNDNKITRRVIQLILLSVLAYTLYTLYGVLSGLTKMM